MSHVRTHKYAHLSFFHGWVTKFHSACRFVRVRRENIGWLAAALLGTHAALLAYGAYLHAPVITETAYLPAGLSHWYFGRFEIERVTPPLVRLVAALPLLGLRPETDWSALSDDPQYRSDLDIGTAFVDANGANCFWLFTLARWACIPFSLLGGYVCYRWAGELYGRAACVAALVLWCFSPMVLGHGQLMLADVPAAALAIAAAYTFRRWLRAPSPTGAAVAGLVLGAAQATRTSLLLLYPLWLILWLVTQRRNIRFRRLVGHDRRFALASQFVLMTAVSVFVLNSVYGFAGIFTPLSQYRFISRALSGLGDDLATPTGNRFDGTFLGRLPVPLPKDYVMGIDIQKADFERGLPSYLCGTWRSKGWWYYYLYGIAFKAPLGTVALALLALLLSLGRDMRRPYEELLLLLPASVFFLFVSAQHGFSIHLRYILPAAPFGFILMSKAAAPVGHWPLALRLLPWGALICTVAGSVSVYPHSLSYFNELAGGPMHGHAYLLDSNMSWGQDLLFLKGWLDGHPEARPLGLAYYGVVSPASAGVEFHVPPTFRPSDIQSQARAALGKRGHWYAIDVNYLRGARRPLRGRHQTWTNPFAGGGDFTYFRQFIPVATAGYGIYIYHIHE